MYLTHKSNSLFKNFAMGVGGELCHELTKKTEVQNSFLIFPPSF